VGTPIVAEGVSYVVGTRGMVFAHDLRNGKLAWVFDPEFRFSPKHLQPNWGARITRGVGYADGKVFLNTGDCRLIAIDAKRGTKVWEAQVCPADDEYTITSAPRIGGAWCSSGRITRTLVPDPATSMRTTSIRANVSGGSIRFPAIPTMWAKPTWRRLPRRGTLSISLRPRVPVLGKTSLTILSRASSLSVSVARRRGTRLTAARGEGTSCSPTRSSRSTLAR